MSRLETHKRSEALNHKAVKTACEILAKAAVSIAPGNKTRKKSLLPKLIGNFIN
jgi:hypothetical protein